MSDAVGTGWVGALRAHTKEIMSDKMFEITQGMCPHNTPLTKEEAYYRELFWTHFGSRNDHLISEIWRPKWTTETDPSARLLIEKNPE